jgi:hypothetical protein
MVDTNDQGLKAYFGENETVAYEEYKAAQGWLFPLATPKLRLDAWGPPYSFKLYDKSCVGLHSETPYVVTVLQQREYLPSNRRS